MNRSRAGDEPLLPVAPGAPVSPLAFVPSVLFPPRPKVPLAGCLDSHAMTGGGPKVATIERSADLPRVLDGAGIRHAGPVIVLIGGAGGLDADLAEALLPVVRDGVVAAAAAVGAAIVDGGTDAGVMAVAGRARSELGVDLPLVGVAPLAKADVAQLVGADGSTRLEPHHSVVLLVPGEDWGAESPWLLHVARTLAGERPVVAVVVDGGPVAMSEALDCAEAGWPVIAISGSGRSADLLAKRTGIEAYPLQAGPAGLAKRLRELLSGIGRGPDAVGFTSVEAPSVSAASRRMAAADYPAIYVAASEAAKRGQRIHRRLSLAEIGLSTVGLVIALLVTSFQPLLGLTDETRTTVIIAVVALAFLASMVVKLVNRSSGFDTDWFAGRALAETVKSQVWRYMMRVAPYDAADADRQLGIDIATMLRRRGGFRQATDRLPERPQQITEQMRAVRALDLDHRRDYYVAQRILDQAEWYRRRSTASSRSAARAFWLSLAFQIAAAGAALLALVEGVDVLRIMALLGAVAVAMTAWSQLNRFDELARAYGSALQELLLISAMAEGISSEEQLAETVQDAEEAVGREHRLWVARRTQQPVEPDEEEEHEDEAE